MISIASSYPKYSSCPKCHGQSVVRQRISKKARIAYEYSLQQYQDSNNNEDPPVAPVASLKSCKNCKGSGLVPATAYPKPLTNYPHIAIIGGGIGGTALAVACLHRGIPFTLYERDTSFYERSQGYGLTLQQASKAMKGLGIEQLENGIVSTRHLVHDPEGNIIGSWGMRKWIKETETKSSKKTNIHIARQSLRWQLLRQLLNSDCVKWNHELDHYTIKDDHVQLGFQVNGSIINQKADLVIGADGIRSKLRAQLITEEKSALHYLGCIVILGICSYEDLSSFKHELLDGTTVFQTANGHERMYMMPYDDTSVMWQFSYPVEEDVAMILIKKGAIALKKDVLKRVKKWHNPIPQVIMATDTSLISGYPVYDRKELQPEWLAIENRITLLGDAAHPMSPFKGQGANQALLDAISLARHITKNYNQHEPYNSSRPSLSFLNSYEDEMITRSSKKVKESAAAVKFLHSNDILKKVDTPRRSFQ